MMKVAIIVLAFILGSAWGMLCDFLWPLTYWKLVPEVMGAAFIGFALTRRTQRWWC